jgi:hypothetical protein
MEIATMATHKTSNASDNPIGRDGDTDIGRQKAESRAQADALRKKQEEDQRHNQDPRNRPYGVGGIDTPHGKPNIGDPNDDNRLAGVRTSMAANNERNPGSPNNPFRDAERRMSPDIENAGLGPLHDEPINTQPADSLGETVKDHRERVAREERDAAQQKKNEEEENDEDAETAKERKARQARDEEDDEDRQTGGGSKKGKGKK